MRAKEISTDKIVDNIIDELKGEFDFEGFDEFTSKYNLSTNSETFKESIKAFIDDCSDLPISLFNKITNLSGLERVLSGIEPYCDVHQHDLSDEEINLITEHSKNSKIRIAKVKNLIVIINMDVVEKLRKKYPEIFGDTDVLNYLITDKSKKTENQHKIAGLVSGYPLSAIETFGKLAEILTRYYRKEINSEEAVREIKDSEKFDANEKEELVEKFLFRINDNSSFYAAFTEDEKEYGNISSSMMRKYGIFFSRILERLRRIDPTQKNEIPFVDDEVSKIQSRISEAMKMDLKDIDWGQLKEDLIL